MVNLPDSLLDICTQSLDRYLNILTFGSLMTAYLLWRNMRLETVGIWRGVSSAVGLVGTIVYRKDKTATFQGMWSIWFQLACVTMSFVGIVLDGIFALYILVGGVILSRVGLWVFDISVTQLMQLHIPEQYRGSVGGTQQALNSTFNLLSYAFGVIWSDPRDFVWLVTIGYSAIIIAALLYTFGLFTQRERLAIQESMQFEAV